MPSLHFQHVSFSYTSAHPVLQDVDLDLGPGWVGVVGANGTGKTTLLDLAVGTITPVTGSVVRHGFTVSCPQRVDHPSPEVDRLAGSFDAEAFVLRGRMALDPGAIGRWSSLSPGERKRWQVAGALFARPDILVLDEPTNHLDTEARRSLVEALEGFTGVGLLVSHDRGLLDGLTTATARVHGGSVSLWHAPYSDARTAWLAEADVVEQRRQAVKRRAKDLDGTLSAQRAAAARSRATYTKARSRSAAKDHDAHSTARKERFRSAEAAGSATRARLAAERARLGEQLDRMVVEKSLGRSVVIEGERAPRPVLVSVVGDVWVGDEILLSGVDFVVERDARIHVVGGNGAGKSTLLAALVEGWDLPPDRLLWLPQELDASAGDRLRRRVDALGPVDKGRVLTLFAALGSDPAAVMDSDSPSPGEARKLALAVALGTDTWLAVLDEPTNHLDLPAVERLEQAVVDYQGALVVASHDERFGRTVTRTRATVVDGTVSPHAG